VVLLRGLKPVDLVRLIGGGDAGDDPRTGERVHVTVVLDGVVEPVDLVRLVARADASDDPWAGERVDVTVVLDGVVEPVDLVRLVAGGDAGNRVRAGERVDLAEVLAVVLEPVSRVAVILLLRSDADGACRRMRGGLMQVVLVEAGLDVGGLADGLRVLVVLRNDVLVNVEVGEPVSGRLERARLDAKRAFEGLRGGVTLGAEELRLDVGRGRAGREAEVGPGARQHLAALVHDTARDGGGRRERSKDLTHLLGVVTEVVVEPID